MTLLFHWSGNHYTINRHCNPFSSANEKFGNHRLLQSILQYKDLALGFYPIGFVSDLPANATIRSCTCDLTAEDHMRIRTPDWVASPSAFRRWMSRLWNLATDASVRGNRPARGNRRPRVEFELRTPSPVRAQARAGALLISCCFHNSAFSLAIASSLYTYITIKR